MELIYNVKVPEGSEDPAAAIEQTITILSKRADPTGTRNLAWKRVADSRLLVQMPSPNEQTKELRANYQTAMSALEEDNHSQGTIRTYIKSRATDSSQINEDLENLYALSKVVDEKRAAAEAAWAAMDAFDLTAEKDDDGNYLQAEKAEELNKVAVAATDDILKAKQAYKDAESKLLSKNFSSLRLERAFNKSTDPIEKQDPNSDTPQQLAIEAFKANYPEKVASIDAAFEAFDAYNSNRSNLETAEDLDRVIRQAGILSFYIAPRHPSGGGEVPLLLNQTVLASYIESMDSKGPASAAGRSYAWFKVDNLAALPRPA